MQEGEYEDAQKRCHDYKKQAAMGRSALMPASLHMGFHPFLNQVGENKEGKQLCL